MNIVIYILVQSYFIDITNKYQNFIILLIGDYYKENYKRFFY